MERLCTTEHGGKRLHGDANHIDVGLLLRERGTGGLRVKAHLHGLRIGRAKAIFHQMGVQAARGAEFRDFFEEIVVRIEEKRQARGEGIDG